MSMGDVLLGSLAAFIHWQCMLDVCMHQITKATFTQAKYKRHPLFEKSCYLSLTKRKGIWTCEGPKLLQSWQMHYNSWTISCSQLSVSAPAAIFKSDALGYEFQQDFLSDNVSFLIPFKYLPE